MGHKVNLNLGYMTSSCVLSEENRLCITGVRKDGEVLLPIDLDLSEFIRACERMSHEDRAVLVCNLALQER